MNVSMNPPAFCIPDEMTDAVMEEFHAAMRNRYPFVTVHIGFDADGKLQHELLAPGESDLYAAYAWAVGWVTYTYVSGAMFLLPPLWTYSIDYAFGWLDAYRRFSDARYTPAERRERACRPKYSSSVPVYAHLREELEHAVNIEYRRVNARIVPRSRGRWMLQFTARPSFMHRKAMFYAYLWQRGRLGSQHIIEDRSFSVPIRRLDDEWFSQIKGWAHGFRAYTDCTLCHVNSFADLKLTLNMVLNGLMQLVRQGYSLACQRRELTQLLDPPPDWRNQK